LFVPALAAGAAISPEAAAGALALSAGALAILNEILDGADDPAGKAKADAGKTEEECEKDRCRKRKNYCISFCQYELDMPGRRDNTGPFRACIRRCMNLDGCPY